MSHTQRGSKKYGVQSFQLQLLHMAAIQNLQDRESQSGVLYSEPETEQTQSFCKNKEGITKGVIPF